MLKLKSELPDTTRDLRIIAAQVDGGTNHAESVDPGRADDFAFQFRDMLGTKPSIASTDTAASKDPPAKASHSSRSSVQQFKTEADAKSHCGTDQVVWGNTSSHALHDPGTKY